MRSLFKRVQNPWYVIGQGLDLAGDGALHRCQCRRSSHRRRRLPEPVSGFPNRIVPKDQKAEAEQGISGSYQGMQNGLQGITKRVERVLTAATSSSRKTP